MKPYRPYNKKRFRQLLALSRKKLTHRQIAEVYGGTEQGVRSNLRRLRLRGVL